MPQEPDDRVLVATRVDRAIADQLGRLAAADRRTRARWLEVQLEQLAQRAGDQAEAG